jgi:Fur family peroxide stress response transcriptional regulator
MNAVENTRASRALLSERLTTSGLRSTRQRKHVYRVLLQRRDHPAADEVFLRAKRDLPGISMATVYNCLDALVKCDLVRLVVLDRGATRYCPNMTEHCHYYCAECGAVFDVPLSASAPLSVSRPKGFKVDHYELAVHGVCADCAGKRKK